MITFPQPLADAYVSPARSILMPTSPGRTVRFMQGHAVVKDGRDLVALMRRPGVKLMMTPYSLSWLEEWIQQAGNERIQAEIQIPDDQPARARGWEPADGADRAQPDQGA